MNTIKIFVSYSHKDEELRRELEAHLSLLMRRYALWSDRKIPPGSEWKGKIDEALNDANIILLLVSADFINSHYCYDVEFKRAMERHDAKEAVVIPIILRPTLWNVEGEDIARLQALPTDGKAVTGEHWKSKDDAYYNIALGLQAFIKHLVEESIVEAPAPQVLLDRQSLHTVLLRLNYTEQAKDFYRSITTVPRVGAFLIHGEPEHGQVWLLNRFLLKVSACNIRKEPFIFPFTPQVQDRSIKALWRKLGKWAGLTKPVDPLEVPQKLVEQVHRLWQDQNIILILNHIEEVDEQYVHTFLKDFWKPLVELARKRPQKHYLLLFLVDNENCVEGWTAPFGQYELAISLKKISLFTAEHVTYWTDSEVDTLHDTLPPERILDGTNGLPQAVLEQICDLCGHDWDEVAGKELEKYG